jgi:glycosyltransferase involved in cell wall biosynthesis
VLSGHRVAVVVPAFREEERIGRTIETMPAFVDSIVVVDDASDDATCEVVSALSDPRVELVRHSQNRGVGRAITTGYRRARQLSADVVAVMAGDGQMDPDDLAEVVAPILEGRADYVKGNRLRHDRAGDMPRVRRVGTRVLGYLTSRAIGAPGLSDSQCGYTAASASLLDRLPLDAVYPRYGYPNDLLAWIVHVGGRVVEVTVRPVYAGERSGLRPWHALVMIGLLARARLRRATR